MIRDNQKKFKVEKGKNLRVTSRAGLGRDNRFICKGDRVIQEAGGGVKRIKGSQCKSGSVINK